MALQDTALSLIRKFGEDRLVTFLIPNATPADPAKPFDVDPTSEVKKKIVPAVVVPIDRKLIDGNSVLDGDEVAIVAGISITGFEPLPEQKIVDETIEKNIIKVIKIKPGKTVFLYKLQVRAP